MSPKILIKGGCVLTLGARTPNFARADVLVADGRVIEVAPGLRARDAESVDATDTIVMPGFVDTHRHAWKSLFRNFGERGGGSMTPAVYGPHHRPEDVYAATLVGLLGAIEAGITTVVDWSDLPSSGGFSEAVLQAHADAGLRTIFVQAAPEWTDDDGDPSRALRNRAAEDLPGTSMRLAHGSSRPARWDFERLAAEWAVARELGLRIHAHSGAEPADRGVVAGLGSRGLLGEDVTLVHCSDLTDTELDAVASTRTSVSLTPSSEMGSGMVAPAIQGLIDRGIRPGLGVDDERVTPGDIFAQMRAIQSLQHATMFDLKLAGKAGLPTLLTTRDVIRYATVDGARVAGLGDVTGSLEPGKQADIVVLRADRPNVFPINDPIGAVVWGMDTSNVDWVFVGGRALVRSGTLQADVAAARGLAAAAQHHVAAAAGLLVDAAGAP